MKKITSTVGSKIKFQIDGSTQVVIDPEESVLVSDQHADLMVERLGGQIAVEDADEAEPVAEPTKEPEEKVEDKVPADEAETELPADE